MKPTLLKSNNYKLICYHMSVITTFSPSLLTFLMFLIQEPFLNQKPILHLHIEYQPTMVEGMQDGPERVKYSQWLHHKDKKVGR